MTDRRERASDPWRAVGGWARTTSTTARVAEAGSTAELGQLLGEHTPRGSIGRGFGRSYGDAAQNAGGRVVATARLDRILSLDADEGLAHVEAGLSIGELNRAVLPLGWIVAAVPGTGRVSVGGAIASDVHGKNHRSDGGFCAHVDSIELVTASRGTVLAGLEHDRDAFLATAGGMGLTGIVASAWLRLQAVESAFVRVTSVRVDDLETALARISQRDSRHAVAWLDLVASGRRLGRGIIAFADHLGIADLAVPERRDPFRLAVRRTVPAWAPGGLITHATIRRANDARFAIARPSSTRIVPVEAFLHPLDRLADASRVYGSSGVVEHHVVLPDHRVDVLETVVATIVARRAPAALAALKRLGSGSGLLSFPLPGWSLAVDYPARWPGLARLLDDLDELVAVAGGRVYLAKDSRLRQDLVPLMYPELERWREIQRRLDPDRQMRSDLDRRLALTG